MLTVGIIGAGTMGKVHAGSFAALPWTRLVGAADVDTKNRAAFTRMFKAPAYRTASELLARARPDMVAVCVPTYLHARCTVEAAEHGCHVLCEKPIATTLAEADRMIRATEKAGTVLMIANVVRFWPEYKLLKKMAENGNLGKLELLDMSRLGPRPLWSWHNWFGSQQKSLGILDLHIHDIDFLRYLLGEPEDVTSFGMRRGKLWVQISTHFRYAGMAARVEGNWALSGTFPFQMSYRAVFERGTLQYNSNANPLLVLYPQKGKPAYPKIPAAPQPPSGKGGRTAPIGSYYDEVKYFVECVRLHRKPAISLARDSRDSLALALRELGSASRNATCLR